MIPLDTFGGTKDNIFDSLKESFVCRNEKSDQYYCVYKKDNSFYDEGFIYESEIDNLINEKNSFLNDIEINNFFKISKITRNGFSELPIVNKINLLVNYFGNEKIFGKSLQDLTFREAISIVEKE